MSFPVELTALLVPRTSLGGSPKARYVGTVINPPPPAIESTRPANATSRNMLPNSRYERSSVSIETRSRIRAHAAANAKPELTGYAFRSTSGRVQRSRRWIRREVGIRSSVRFEKDHLRGEIAGKRHPQCIPGSNRGHDRSGAKSIDWRPSCAVG